MKRNNTINEREVKFT